MDAWLVTLFFLEIIFFTFSVFNIFALERVRNFLYLFFPLIMTSIIGCLLFYLTLHQRAGGFAKVFLLMVGAAPAVMFVSVILHNFVSAGITSLRRGKEFEEPVFFLLAIFGCPGAFLVGAIGTIVSLIRTLIK